MPAVQRSATLGQPDMDTLKCFTYHLRPQSLPKGCLMRSRTALRLTLPSGHPQTALQVPKRPALTAYIADIPVGLRRHARPHNPTDAL